jgi:hypothetical protein
MPAVSEKQKHLMDAAAHNPAFAKKVGIPAKVAKEFSSASKGQKFSKGGDTMASKMNAGFMAMMAKKKDAPTKKMANGGITTAKMGKVKTAAPSKDGVATKGKTKGTMVAMKGSTPLGMKSGGMTKKMNYGGKC